MILMRSLVDFKKLALIFWAALIISLGLFTGSWSTAAAATAAENEGSDANQNIPSEVDIKKTIELLEDEQKRKEVIRLLKLLETMQGETPQKTLNAALKSEPEKPNTIKAYLKNWGNSVYRNISLLGPSLRESAKNIKSIFKAMMQPKAVEVWGTFARNVCLWGLACLVAAWLVIKKYGGMPNFKPTFAGRLGAFLKHLLVVAGPNMLLIISFLAMPSMSTIKPGITADMVSGFNFLHDFLQGLFVTFSVLYIFLRAASALVSENSAGQRILNIQPELAATLLSIFRIVAIYTAVSIFVGQTFLNHLLHGPLRSLFSILISVPLPIYLTFKLSKLNKQINASNGMIFEKPMKSASETGEVAALLPLETKPRPTYKFDSLIKKHWAKIIVAYTWVVSLIAIFNPAGLAGHFLQSLFGSIVSIIIAMGLINIERRLALRVFDYENDQGRKLVIFIDTVTNVVIWTGTLLSILTSWGLPLNDIIYNPLVSEISSRLLAIVIALTVMLFVLKFSSMVTGWLMEAPDLSKNRLWRTMTPLIETAVRALAIFITIVAILDRLGVNVGPILAGAGILGLGVGMGAQSLVKDIINGISILLMDTLAIGDFVKVGSVSGTVEALGLRTLRLRDSSGNLVVIPNSIIDTIINMTKDYSQELIEVPVPYNFDPDKAMSLLRNVAKSMDEDEFWSTLLVNNVEVVGIINIDAQNTTIRLKVHTSPGVQWAAGRELRLRIKRAFLAAGMTPTPCPAMMRSVSDV